MSGSVKAFCICAILNLLLLLLLLDDIPVSRGRIGPIYFVKMGKLAGLPNLVENWKRSETNRLTEVQSLSQFHSQESVRKELGK